MECGQCSKDNGGKSHSTVVDRASTGPVFNPRLGIYRFTNVDVGSVVLFGCIVAVSARNLVPRVQTLLALLLDRKVELFASIIDFRDENTHRKVHKLATRNWSTFPLDTMHSGCNLATARAQLLRFRELLIANSRILLKWMMNFSIEPFVNVLQNVTQPGMYSAWRERISWGIVTVIALVGDPFAFLQPWGTRMEVVRYRPPSYLKRSKRKKKRRLDPWHCLTQRWRTSWLSTVIPRCAWAGRAASTAMVAAMRKVLKIDSILYMFRLQWRYPSYFNPSFIYTMYPSDTIDSEA